MSCPPHPDGSDPGTALLERGAGPAPAASRARLKWRAAPRRVETCSDSARGEVSGHGVRRKAQRRSRSASCSPALRERLGLSELPVAARAGVDAAHDPARAHGSRLRRRCPFDRELVLDGGRARVPAGGPAPARARLGQVGLPVFRARRLREDASTCTRARWSSRRSNQRVDRLGECLLRSGAISAEQLLEAERVYQPPAPFGRFLVELGFLSPRELWDGVKAQVEEIVRSLFAFGAGQRAVLGGRGAARQRRAPRAADAAPDRGGARAARRAAALPRAARGSRRAAAPGRRCAHAASAAPSARSSRRCAEDASFPGDVSPRRDRPALRRAHRARCCARRAS